VYQLVRDYPVFLSAEKNRGNRFVLGLDSRLFDTILKLKLWLQVIVSKLRSEREKILSKKTLQSGEEVKLRVKRRVQEAARKKGDQWFLSPSKTQFVWSSITFQLLACF